MHPTAFPTDCQGFWHRDPKNLCTCAVALATVKLDFFEGELRATQLEIASLDEDCATGKFEDLWLFRRLRSKIQKPC